jgi:hypothetical protein
MKMSNTRRFAEALGSWLHFEACCFRAGLFSESSFKSAIGSVASSLHADHKAARVHADYPLPAIQRVPDAERTGGGGRKRSVDFAVIYDDKRMPASNPEVLIEAKWAGSSHCSTANIMADFIRLAIMKRAHPEAICLFLLAGRSKDVGDVLRRRPFIGGSRDIIRCDGTGTMKKFKFLPLDVNQQAAYAKAISAFHAANISVPSELSVSGSLPYPATPATFQAVAWEVIGVGLGNVSRAEWDAQKVLAEEGMDEVAII